jgi:long-chain acyl-CoA synthetase
MPAMLEGEKKANIPNMFKVAATKFADKNCMGTRSIEYCKVEGKKQFWKKGPPQWTKYSEVYQNVQHGAKGLVGLAGIKELRKDKKAIAAILADTSAEWQTSAQACFKVGLPVTTVYTTLGHEAMIHGLNETESAVLFLDWGQYGILKDPVLSKCPNLKHIVLIGKCFVPLDSNEAIKHFPTTADCAGLAIGSTTVTTFPALIDAGKESDVNLEEFDPDIDDLAFIMYTSGSTGLPKGVMLRHSNFVALIASVLAQGTLNPTTSDVFCAFLPLAHILELMVETTCLVSGSGIGYAHARTVTAASPYVEKTDPGSADLTTYGPTILVCVPAILETIKNGLNTNLSAIPGFKGSLVRTAVQKAQGLPSEEGAVAGFMVSLGIGNMLIGKIKTQMGLQNLRIIGSGGAPLASQTQDFIAHVLAPVAQGYGATETTGCATMQECLPSNGRKADGSCGCVGAIQPACEVKLLSVPEMGYVVDNDPPRGEVLIAGNAVSCDGYYKMETKSAEDFPVHKDGKKWFHTGDVGEMTKAGTLKIIDRKKDLIKLSSGEYVSLGKVEATLKEVHGIGAVVVFAQSDKNECVCIVSQPERGWAAVGGKPEEEALVKDIAATLKTCGLAAFEIPRKVKVTDEIWTPESGLVTASLKLQRNPLREHYNKPGDLLEQMGYRFPTA